MGRWNRPNRQSSGTKSCEHLLGGDSCHNIDRIMRLPGTINVPTKKKLEEGRKPALATVVEADWSRDYDLSAFTPAQPSAHSERDAAGHVGKLHRRYRDADRVS